MSTRGKKISEIKSSLLRPALTSHFEVQIPIPSKMREKGSSGSSPSFLEYNDISFNSVNQSKLNLLCCEAVLPGSSLATLEINGDFHGVTQRHAYRRIYDDRIDLTFYVDSEEYLPIKYFETWMKFCVDESIGPQSDKGSERGIGSKSMNYFYRVRYPDDYISPSGLRVIKYERDYRKNLVYDFVGCFPISVSSMPVSYESSSLLKCTVSLNYIRYVLSMGKNDPVISTDSELTAEQQAALNSVQLKPFEFTYDPAFEGPFSVGGVPDFGTSGNSVYTSDSEGPQSTLGQAFSNV